MLPQNWVATAKQNRTHEIPQNHTQTSTYISHPLSRYRITKRCYHRIFESPNTNNLQVTGGLMQSSHISPQLRKQYFTPIKEAVLSTNISARCRITESIKSMAISDFLATTLNKSVTTDFWGASVSSSQFYIFTQHMAKTTDSNIENSQIVIPVGTYRHWWQVWPLTWS